MVITFHVDEAVKIIAHDSYNVFEKLYYRNSGVEEGVEIFNAELNPLTFLEYNAYKKIIESQSNSAKRLDALGENLSINMKPKIMRHYMSNHRIKIPELQKRIIDNYVMCFKCDGITNDENIVDIVIRANGVYPEEIPYDDYIRLNLHMFLMSKPNCTFIECVSDTEYKVKTVEFDRECIMFVLNAIDKISRKLKAMIRIGVVKPTTIKKHFDEILEYIDG